MNELEICNELGVTPTGLRMLAQAVDNRGEARGVGFDGSSGTRAVLMRQGLVESGHRIYRGPPYPTHVVTEQGRAKVDQARGLGWF